MSRSRSVLLFGVFLAAAWFVSAPSIPGEYVYDDLRFVQHNPAVTEGAALVDYFADPGTQTADESFEGLYRPLRTLSFRAVHALERGPGAQKTVNLLLHALNGLLVFALLRRLVRGADPWPAAIGALAFVVHPMAVESVAWVSSRGDVLATTGLLLAVFLSLRGGRVRRFGVPAAFLLALLVKESAAVAPLLIALVDLRTGGIERVRKHAAGYAVQAAILAAFLVVRQAVLGAAQFGQGTGLDLSSGKLAEWLGVGMTYYGAGTVCPTGLGFDHWFPEGSGRPLAAALGLLLTLAAVCGAFLLRRRSPEASLGLAWFLIALLPVTLLQFVFPLKILFADRFAYTSLVGAAMVLAFVAARGRPFAIAALLLALAFVPLARARAATWKNHETLWGDVLSRQPDHRRAPFALAMDRMRRGEIEKARTLLRQAVGADPTNPRIHQMCGEAAEVLGSRPEVTKEQRTALFREAYDAYHEAIRLWEAPGRRDRLYYREALLPAAVFAIWNREGERATLLAWTFVTNPDALPGPGPYRDRMIRRLDVLARFFGQSGNPDMANALQGIAGKLRSR